MKTFYRTLAMFLLIALAFVQNANSYGVTTHAAISVNAWQAATNAQTNFFQALQFDTQKVFGPVPATPPAGIGPFTAKGWIIAGSQYEDDEPLPLFINVPAARVLFHFLDPYYNRGLSLPPYISLTSTSSDWGVFGTGSSVVCLPPPPAGTVPICIPVVATNDFPYASTDPTKNARMHFYNGLTKPDATIRDKEFGAMFRTLGQVIHLLQDTAQPQHARNDFHLDLSATRLAFVPDSLQRPSAYERHVDARTDLQTLPGTGTQIRFTLPQLFFANGSSSGLAQFTNTNFVSAGTNCTNTITCNAVGNYPAPTMTGGPTNRLYNGGVLTFYTNQVSDKYTNTTSQNNRMTTNSLFDPDLLATNNAPVFSLNHFNYDAQASILIPKAVDYSAGLLNHFFRASMNAQGGPTGFTITNNTMNGTTPEPISGTFSPTFALKRRFHR